MGDSMKAMVCEMCGSNDVVKADGVYVCQHCGTKYTTEEARKLLVEVSGPVNVVGVATPDNLLDRAQEFLDKGDGEKASEYVNRALDIDAQYERARDMQRLIEERSKPKGRMIGNVEVTEEQYAKIVEPLREGKKIAAIKEVRALSGLGLKEAKEYVESVVMPELGIEPPVQEKSSGGCYVATAVYGSYDCPEVWTLRRFRDYRLARTRGGRLFVRAYYAVSPKVVEMVGDTALFGRLLRGPLDRLVSRCRESGLEDTPYEDRPW
jgi:uncharacterized Zn finger protein (UPF0148 family)